MKVEERYYRMNERTLKSMDIPLAHCDNILAKRDWYKQWFVFCTFPL